MSLMGTALGRGLAAAAGGAVETINKYIDNELMMQRAQATADIQRNSNMQEYTDKDAFAHDPTRVARNLSEATNSTVAAGNAARQVKVADLQDPNLTSLTRQKKLDDATAAHDQGITQKIADSGNPSLLKAIADLENADPTKKATIDHLNAQARQEDAKAMYMRNAGSSGAMAGAADHKMDEVDKIEYQNLFGQVKTEAANLSKFEAEGQPLDADGKPTGQYALVKKNVAEAQRKLLSFKMRKGLLNPEDLASQAIAGENDSTKIGAAIAQAYTMGGNEFGDKFYAKVRASGALERNSEVATEPPAKKKNAESGSPESDNKTGKPTYSFFDKYQPHTRLQYLENLEREGKLTPLFSAELDAMRQSAK